MPRVVQVPSSETEEVNLYNADSSENEDTANRNFNQTVNSGQERVATYMRFPINYALYNVTYLDSENDPYCLRCVIGGRVKKFKKDARTWLHKSSDKKMKMDDESRYPRNVGNAAATKNMRLASDAQEFIACGGAYRSNTYNTDIGNDVLSEISSLGDSEADLTYSEESSPSLSSETREKHQKCVRFDHNIHARYRSQSISSDSDESVNAVGKTTSSRNIVFQEELKFMEEEDDNIYGANESRNNVRSCPLPLQVSKIAPAIINETASLQETLLERTANNKAMYYHKPKPSPLAFPDVQHKTKCGTRLKRRNEENTRMYNLRSARKFDPYFKENDRDKIVPSIKRQCCKETNHNDGDMSFVKPGQVIGTDEAPSCSKRTESDEDCSVVVPKLFFLASLALYIQMKSNLNKCT